jgi:hypothetical protein
MVFLYAAAGDPCVAAHSTTRALYASYSGLLYQILRQSENGPGKLKACRPIRYWREDATGWKF